MKACMGLISEERRGGWMRRLSLVAMATTSVRMRVRQLDRAFSMPILRLFPVTRVMSEIPRGGVCHLIPGRGHYTR